MVRMRSMMVLASAACAALVASSAPAAFVAVDTFESGVYTVGASVTGSVATGVVSGNGWTVTNHAAGDFVIAIDPAGGTNRVLHGATYQSSTAYRDMGPEIGAADTGTVFFRFRRTATDADFAIGASQTVAAAAFSDLAGYALLGADSTTPAVADPLRIRDGSTSRVTNALTADTWYSVWLVLNNNANTYQAYLQGGAFAAQTQLFGYNAGTSAYDVANFAFRNTAAGAIQSFEIAGGGGGAGSNVYVDDIYIDSSSPNFTNPVPEPASVSLIGLGALALLRGRHRRA